MPRSASYVHTDDGRLYVETGGNGLPVLFLHGVSASHRTWHPVAERLEGRFRVLLPDLLSRGASDPRPDLRYSLGDELRRMRELLGRLGVRPTLVAGHSQGAAIAIALAAAEPGVRGILLANPVSPWTRRPLSLGLLRSGLMRRTAGGIIRPFRRPVAWATLRRVYGPDTRVTRERVSAYAAPFGDPRRARALLRVLADWRPVELEPWLGRCRGAVGVLAGERDPRVAPESARRLAAELHARYRLVPRVGHALPEEVPSVAARAVVDLFESLDVRERGPVR